MKIKVKAFYSIRDALEAESIIEVEVDAITIRGVIRKLADQYGKKFQKELYINYGDEINPRVRNLVNGQHYNSMPHKLDSQLKDDDILAIFPYAHADTKNDSALDLNLSTHEPQK